MLRQIIVSTQRPVITDQKTAASLDSSWIFGPNLFQSTSYNLARPESQRAFSYDIYVCLKPQILMLAERLQFSDYGQKLLWLLRA